MPHSTYLPHLMGEAVLEPPGPYVAGSRQTLVLTYTAGKFGIDDTGALKVSWRTTSDMAKPQFTDPAAPNYVTVRASNGAVLEVRFDRVNVRPWANTIFIRVGRGFLRAGDRIVVTLGDRSGGSPGYRMQTNAEKACSFLVYVDAFATYDFVELPRSPTFDLVPGPPVAWKAILPTRRRTGDPFRMAIVANDLWGNPSDRVDATVALRASRPIAGLPDSLRLRPGDGPAVVEGLRVETPGDLAIDLRDQAGTLLARSNPLSIETEPDYLAYWGDLHGQSGETIGMGSARDYFLFARDKAFVDVVGHQGNDFQITRAFWEELNRLTREFHEPGRFVTLPGYEWSGNTGMGGDRNVFFPSEDAVIHRSSHALVPDLSDVNTDCHTAADLFNALADRDAVCIAHVGGRYADISVAHDGRLEPSVEIHSTWGTFEWLLHDAFRLGYRVGIVCNSDDHKGRQGAAHPGASSFGAIGGLTCLLMPELTREAVFRCLRARRHYGTTGARILLDVRMRFDREADLFDGDPALGPTDSRKASRALMGDIVRPNGAAPVLEVDTVGSAPIERVTVFNGTEAIDLVRPHDASELGRRVRVLWEGAEYRGRGRETSWHGSARLAANRFVRATPVNFLNPENRLVTHDGTALQWQSVTTGNMAGFDLILADPDAGEIAIDTSIVQARARIADIGLEEIVFDGGGLGRRIRLFRLPDEGGRHALRFERPIEVRPDRDNPIYVRVTQEDGHQAWSSPIYLVPGG